MTASVGVKPFERGEVYCCRLKWCLSCFFVHGDRTSSFDEIVIIHFHRNSNHNRVDENDDCHDLKVMLRKEVSNHGNSHSQLSLFALWILEVHGKFNPISHHVLCGSILFVGASFFVRFELAQFRLAVFHKERVLESRGHDSL